jgi:hypothetical protein
MLHRKNEKSVVAPCSGSKQREINGFIVACIRANSDLVGSGRGRPRIENEGCGVPIAAPSRSGFQPMPRYFFNARIADELIADPEGEVLRNPDRAWEMARAMIRELLKTEGVDERLLNATIEVTDDEGGIVLEFPFAEALLDAEDESRTKH